MSELEKEVERLTGEVAQLRDDLSKAAEKLDAARVRFATEKYDIRIGMIVKTRKGLFRVTNIQCDSYRTKPWAIGNPQKKDGTYGCAERHLYSDWEIVA